MVTDKQLMCSPVVALAVMTLLLGAGKIQLAVAALLSLFLYLMPSKLQKPSNTCLAQPEATAPWRRIVLHHSESNAVGKVSLNDASLLHDELACGLWVRQFLAPATKQRVKQLQGPAQGQLKAVQASTFASLKMGPTGQHRLRLDLGSKKVEAKGEDTQSMAKEKMQGNLHELRPAPMQTNRRTPRELPRLRM